ncbi:MAG: hypothetical protein ABW140_08415 [Candidatus Sedimenticola sp. 6PFRAG1]
MTIILNRFHLQVSSSGCAQIASSLQGASRDAEISPRLHCQIAFDFDLQDNRGQTTVSTYCSSLNKSSDSIA